MHHQTIPDHHISTARARRWLVVLIISLLVVAASVTGLLVAAATPAPVSAPETARASGARTFPVPG